MSGILFLILVFFFLSFVCLFKKKIGASTAIFLTRKITTKATHFQTFLARDGVSQDKCGGHIALHAGCEVLSDRRLWCKTKKEPTSSAWGRHVPPYPSSSDTRENEERKSSGPVNRMACGVGGGQGGRRRLAGWCQSSHPTPALFVIGCWSHVTRLGYHFRFLLMKTLPSPHKVRRFLD